ncbi:MAG: hypothetical protein KatS3mg102_1589 [Planctomycetota bacterium]|nr:MAG: hypothetical protein KatS3mg102_1589 [Planctomycetota bacterium]
MLEQRELAGVGEARRLVLPARAGARGRARAREGAAGLGAWAAALAVAGLLGWLVGEIAAGGAPALSWSLLAEAPADAGRAGGILPILVSTLLLVGVCLSVALPLGLGAAVWLAELAAAGGRRGRWVRASLDALAGVPSIVMGLFGSALFCRTLGLGYSILAGGLTLACMALPIAVRAAEQGLREAAGELRRAAAALGLGRAATLLHVLLPAAAPALLVGVVLGIGRAAAETAALLFTSGYVDRMPGSLLDSGRSLSIHIYDLAMHVPGGNHRAYASALVLLAVLLCLNALAGWMADRWLARAHARC